MGCATADISFDCPPIKEYTVEEQKAAAEEVMKASPQIQQFLLDYYKLREKVRACNDTVRKTQ